MDIAIRSTSPFPSLLAKDLRLALPAVIVCASVIGVCFAVLALVPAFGPDAMRAFAFRADAGVLYRLSVASPVVDAALLAAAAASGALMAVGDGSRGAAAMFATVPASGAVRILSKVAATAIVAAAFMLAAELTGGENRWGIAWCSDLEISYGTGEAIANRRTFGEAERSIVAGLHVVGFAAWGLACGRFIRRPGWAVPAAIGLAIASAAVVSVASRVGLGLVVEGIDRWDSWDSRGIDPRFIRLAVIQSPSSLAWVAPIRIDLSTAATTAGIGVVAASFAFGRLAGGPIDRRMRRFLVPAGMLAAAVVAGCLAGLPPRGGSGFDYVRLAPRMLKRNADARQVASAYAAARNASPEAIVTAACDGWLNDDVCRPDLFIHVEECLATAAGMNARLASAVSRAIRGEGLNAADPDLNPYSWASPESVAARMVLVERCAMDPAPIRAALEALLRDATGRVTPGMRIQAAAFLGPQALGDLAARRIAGATSEADRAVGMSLLSSVDELFNVTLDASGKAKVATTASDAALQERWRWYRRTALRALDRLQSDAASRAPQRPAFGGLDVPVAVDVRAIETARAVLRAPMPGLADALRAGWESLEIVISEQPAPAGSGPDSWDTLIGRDIASLRMPASDLVP